MNKIILLGRLTKNINLKYAGENKTAIATSTIAVNRRYEKEKADFINIKAFGKTAEIIALYLTKGVQVGISGRLQINSYDKDGEIKYFTEVIIEEFTFCGSKKEKSEHIISKTPEGKEGFEEINEDDYPF